MLAKKTTGGIKLLLLWARIFETAAGKANFAHRSSARGTMHSADYASECGL